MSLIVITPSASIMTPAEIPGSHAGDDPVVQALIDAATARINGPNSGQYRIALGVQTLEYRLSRFPVGAGKIDLLFGPIISLESIKFTDPDGASVTMSLSDYEFSREDQLVRPAINTCWPVARGVDGSVRIRYVAGHDGSTTGSVPIEIKRAIVLMVLKFMTAGVENLHISEVSVEGVGVRKYVVSDAAMRVLDSAAENLLAGVGRNQ